MRFLCNDSVIFVIAIVLRSFVDTVVIMFDLAVSILAINKSQPFSDVVVVLLTIVLLNSLTFLECLFLAGQNRSTLTHLMSCNCLFSCTGL
jgi:hypothetical protein